MLRASIVVEMTKALTSGCSRLPMLYQMLGIGKEKQGNSWGDQLGDSHGFIPGD
jgi:hypothetical protein